MAGPSNALVICNHDLPTPGRGRGIAEEMSGALAKVLPWQCVGKYPGFALDRQKRAGK